MNRNILFAVAPIVTWQGFVDTYYAWDFNRPMTKERSYTTQPVKLDAFGINLAMLGAKVEQGKKRGVLTLQYGDSVDINYAAEPKQGEGLKHLQEAYAGIKLSDEIWLDAGIYLGHIGNESWVSKDNWTYSRSLQLDYVPYYTTGLRLSGKNWQFHLLNGWQNIRENNNGKAVGTQYLWRFGEKALTYNTQVGHELFPGRQTSGLRTYQNLHLEIPGEKVDWKGAIDVGTQNVPGKEQALAWGATSSQWRWRFKEAWAAAGRVEYFHDHKGAINPTGAPGGFRVFGVSVNIDHTFEEGALARFEIRRLQNSDAIYSGKGDAKDHDTFVAGSLSVTF
jgi:hypothetical protein